jgi:hypothetical protein
MLRVAEHTAEQRLDCYHMQWLAFSISRSLTKRVFWVNDATLRCKLSKGLKQLKASRRFLLNKITITQLVKIFIPSGGTRKIVAAFTTVILSMVTVGTYRRRVDFWRIWSDSSRKSGRCLNSATLRQYRQVYVQRSQGSCFGVYFQK